MEKISNVKCVYTGGGVWVYHAMLGKNFLYGSLDQFIELYDADPDPTIQLYVDGKEYDDSDESYMDFDYDAHYVSDVKMPTWRQIRNSLQGKDAYVEGVDDAVRCLEYWNDLSKRTNEE